MTIRITRTLLARLVIYLALIIVIVSPVDSRGSFLIPAMSLDEPYQHILVYYQIVFVLKLIIVIIFTVWLIRKLLIMIGNIFVVAFIDNHKKQNQKTLWSVKIPFTKEQFGPGYPDWEEYQMFLKEREHIDTTKQKPKVKPTHL